MTATTTRRFLSWSLLFSAVFAGASQLRAQELDRTAIINAVDSIAMEPIDSGLAAGMSVAVIHGSDTIVLKGYGYADLEFDVPTPERAIYEIGSVTKQFTAVAVLQLHERGLLALDDELTKYLPDYPTHGHRITIRRLLDHTSGIKGYTELPTFWNTMVGRSLPRDSLVALFSAEPFDFAPGEAMIYNNSAYFLLGLIIEKASGQPYEEYIQEHIFGPAGMVDSRYCSERAVIKRRANGYQMGDSGLVRKGFLVHDWPYAAGSICSTAWDLVTWTHAVHGQGEGGHLLSPDAYRELITPGELNDGTRLRYAKGLAITETGGRRQISHGGGIFGFLSESRYYPDDDLIIVVLINTAGRTSPSSIASAIEKFVLGDRRTPPSRTYAGELEIFTGTYTGPGRGRELEVTVAADSGHLTLQIGSGEAEQLRYVDDHTFSMGTTLCHFVRHGNHITELQVDRVGGFYILEKDSS
jgi:CubicO group peptidase (beta-lactamase class C family)